MSSLFKSWKTTLFGALAAGFGAIGMLSGNLTFKEAAPAFFAAAIGFLAKDHNVTGGDTKQ